MDAALELADVVNKHCLILSALKAARVEAAFRAKPRPIDPGGEARKTNSRPEASACGSCSYKFGA